MQSACTLFYQEGIQAVGIQRLIDDAGIAKASLYAHFESKDELVAAYLEQRSVTWRKEVEEQLGAASHLSARARLLRVFDLFVAWVEGSDDFRGCPFQNACGEVADPSHPVKAVTKAHREWLRGLIVGLVHEIGLTSPDRLAGTLMVLLDGASASAMMERDATPARNARWAAEHLLDSAGSARKTAKPAKR
jgi:AcrR family transcriptional regulator